MDNLNDILDVLTTADKGCSYCIRDIFHVFIKKFPHLENEVHSYYKNKFEKDLGEDFSNAEN